MQVLTHLNFTTPCSPNTEMETAGIVILTELEEIKDHGLLTATDYWRIYQEGF